MVCQCRTLLVTEGKISQERANLATVRAFLGIHLPVFARRDLASIGQCLRVHNGQIKWVEPHLFHFTLAFLGEISTELIPEISRATAQAVSAMPIFELEVAGFGAFPRPDEARVLWLGIKDGSDALEAVHRQVWMVLAEFGFSSQESFHPHLTLGRVKRNQGQVNVTNLVEAYADKTWTRFRVEELTLFRSELTRRAPIYSELASMPLYK